MRFVISTYFNDKNFNIPSQRLEIKTNELQRAFEVCRAFVIGSKSCKMDIWENKNKTKKPDYGAILGFCDVVNIGGILTNEIIFNSWILDFMEKVKKFQRELNHDLKKAKNV